MKTCEYCGNEFIKRPNETQLYYDRRRFCGSACRTQHIAGVLRKVKPTKYDSSKYSTKEIVQMSANMKIAKVAEELGISHQRVSRIVKREEELGRYPELIKEYKTNSEIRRREAIKVADQFNANKNGTKYVDVNSIPERFCQRCGKKLLLNKRASGFMESPTQFAKRKYCNRECVKIKKNKAKK